MSVYCTPGPSLCEVTRPDPDFYEARIMICWTDFPLLRLKTCSEIACRSVFAGRRLEMASGVPGWKITCEVKYVQDNLYI